MQILSADENNTRSGFSDEQKPTRFAKTKAASFAIDPETHHFLGTRPLMGSEN